MEKMTIRDKMNITDTNLFQVGEIKKGDFVHNMTDDVYSIVKSVESSTTLTIRKPNIFDMLWLRFKYWASRKYQQVKTYIKSKRQCLKK